MYQRSNAQTGNVSDTEADFNKFQELFNLKWFHLSIDEIIVRITF
jgi:hypothetical protein